MTEGFFVHAFASIRDRYLYVRDTFSFFLRKRLRFNRHGTTLGCEFPGIVSDGVDHKERQGAVCFHHSVSWLHNKANTIEREAHGTVADDIKDLLQGEVLYFQTQFALPHLNPLCKDIVVFIDAVGELFNILQALAVDLLLFRTFRFFSILRLPQSFNLIHHSVDEWQNAANELHLSTLFKVPLSVLLKV